MLQPISKNNIHHSLPSDAPHTNNWYLLRVKAKEPANKSLIMR